MPSYGTLRAYTEQLAPEWHWHKFETTSRAPDTAPLEESLLNLKPDVVCGTAYVFNIEILLKLCRKVRDVLPGARIVLGGPEFPPGRDCPPEADAVICGDETSFHWYLRRNAVIEGCYSGSLDDLPSPSRLGYIAPGKPSCMLETARGCGGDCLFCTRPAKQIKYYSQKRIEDDLQALHHAGFREIRVSDRTLARNQVRAARLLKMFRIGFPDMRFRLEIEPSGLQPELLSEMADGNFLLKAKVQSLSSGVQTNCLPRGNPAGLLQGIYALLEHAKSEVHIELIAGLPGQTLRNLIDDVRTLVRLRPHKIRLKILSVLPGTPLWHTMTDYDPCPPYRVRSTPDMSPEDLRAALRLSQILDDRYNVPHLRPEFIRTVRKNPDYLDRLLDG